MNTDIVTRRATADDYDSVIKIVDDLYDGLDYLPTLYHVFRQTKQHVFNVADIHGKVVRDTKRARNLAPTEYRRVCDQVGSSG